MTRPRLLQTGGRVAEGGGPSGHPAQRRRHRVCAEGGRPGPGQRRLHVRLLSGAYVADHRRQGGTTISANRGQCHTETTSGVLIITGESFTLVWLNTIYFCSI